MSPSHLSDLDLARLEQALEIAERAIGLSDPNPRVGCVIGRADGTVLGQGHTQRAGQAHAEVMALRDAQAAGQDVRGATAWVTLEPCSHQGRTPPCSEALVAAGLARTVVAMVDPNPLVLGRGIERLRAAGLVVDVADGPIVQRAEDLNIGFVSRHRRGRPWVRMKLAQSLDGRSALSNGASQWITGAEARADGHAWRRRAGAIVTGIGTVLADDPRLDVRLVPTERQPLRVIVDSTWRTPPSARALAAPGRAAVAGLAAGADAASRRLGDRADIVVLAPDGPSGSRIHLAALMAWLHAGDCHEVHAEAGAMLSGALLQAGLVDELLIYQAPLLLGPGRPSVTLPGRTTLQGLDRWVTADLSRVGTDVRWRLRRVHDPMGTSVGHVAKIDSSLSRRTQ